VFRQWHLRLVEKQRINMSVLLSSDTRTRRALPSTCRCQETGKTLACVHFEGVGGATLRPKEHKCIWSFRQAVADHQPDIIFLHIGENDLRSLPPGDITREIMLLVNDLATLNRHPVVILGQSISFPTTQHLMFTHTVQPSLGLSPLKIGEGLSEIWPNRLSKFHTDR